MPARRLIGRGLWAACTLLAAASCTTASSDSRYFGKVVPPEGQVLRYISGSEPESLDPQISTGQPEARIQYALFDGLTEAHPQTSEPIPSLAERWDSLRENTEFVFHLRPNLRWSNGRPLVASDFVYSLRRGLTPALAARAAYLAYDIEYAQAYNEVEGTTSGYYAYYKDFPAPTTELYMGGGRAMFVFPTNDDETCIGVEFFAARFPEFKSDIEGNIRKALETVPNLGARFAGATRNSKVMGLTPHKSFYRKPYGPGWALVGDAGYFRDPLLGQGINDAFRDADELALALDASLNGARAWDDALAGYEKQRNDATTMVYNLTALLCRDLDPSPETMAMMAGGPPPVPAG